MGSVQSRLVPHLAVFEAPRVTSTSARTTLLMTFHIPHHAAATLISTSEKLLGTFWVLRRVEKRNERSRVEGCRLTTALGIRRLSAYLGGLHKLIGCSNRQRVNATVAGLVHFYHQLRSAPETRDAATQLVSGSYRRCPSGRCPRTLTLVTQR